MNKSKLPLRKGLLIAAASIGFLHSSAQATLITVSFTSVLTQVFIEPINPGILHTGDQISGVLTIDTTTGKIGPEFFDGGQPIAEGFDEGASFSGLDNPQKVPSGYAWGWDMNDHQLGGYDLFITFHLFTISPTAKQPPLSTFQENTMGISFSHGVGDGEFGDGHVLSITVPETGATALLFSLALTGIVLLYWKLAAQRS
jgi:hypothetical protein